MTTHHDIQALLERAAGFSRPGPGMRASNQWYQIRAEQDDRTPVYIYGEVGGWDYPASAFVQDLRNITTPVDLHINSGGGSVFDGMAIYAALRNHTPGVMTIVDSIAASAASFIAMAGQEIVMEKPAKMMIHDASGLVLGNAADMREMADLLDDISDTIAEVYADRAGGDVSTWRTAMQAETWYSSAQAVEAGLADRVAGEASGSDSTASNIRRSQLIRARARATLRG